jgi:hypothetical protein
MLDSGRVQEFAIRLESETVRAHSAMLGSLCIRDNEEQK